MLQTILYRVTTWERTYISCNTWHHLKGNVIKMKSHVRISISQVPWYDYFSKLSGWKKGFKPCGCWVMTHISITKVKICLKLKKINIVVWRNFIFSKKKSWGIIENHIGEKRDMWKVLANSGTWSNMVMIKFLKTSIFPWRDSYKRKMSFAMNKNLIRKKLWAKSG